MRKEEYMNIELIKTAEAEAKRFLERAAEARKRLNIDSYAKYGCRETGAVKRASLDLSRALADMRKPR